MDFRSVTIMRNDCDDIPKHRKKKKSSTSRSNSKAKHKHDYSKECLLITEGNNHSHYATYCGICGKIENVKFFESVREDNGYYRLLDADEVYRKHSNLENIFVNSVW